MRTILTLFTGAGIAVLLGIFYSHRTANSDYEVKNKKSGTKKTKATRKSSKMAAPASQPEVLPPSKSKKSGGLTNEAATGNTD